MKNLFITTIKILDLEISVTKLIIFLSIFTILLLFIYFINTFPIFKSKKNNNWENIIKIKQETCFEENIKYFEQEIMLAKKNNNKN